MAAEHKPKISARQVLSDIHSGMELSKLKRKYGLSDKGAESLFRKLLAKGLVTQGEIPQQLGLIPLPESSSQNKAASPAWRCPACNTPQDEEYAECPSCGVVTAKFGKRKTEAAAPIAYGSKVRADIPKPWMLVVFAAAAILFLGGVLLLMPKTHIKEKRKLPRIVEKVKTVVASGRKINLKYSPKGYPFGLSVHQGFALHLFDTPNPNQVFRKMPPETGLKRYYDEFKIAGRKFLVITEQSNPPKMYLDANGDGDLTNDRGPFVGERSSVVPNHYPLLLPYKGEPKEVPYRIWLFNSRMGGTRFYPECHWHGEVMINGVSYKLVLFDQNADGDYSNDRLVIDIDNNGKAAEGEMLKPGENCKVNGTDVKLVSISPSGRWVRLDF